MYPLAARWHRDCPAARSKLTLGREESVLIAGLVNHYRIVGTLGAGGMGVVYKAIDTRLNRPVAIKAIAERGALDTSAALRLRREALAAASLDHPYICKIYELLETDADTLIVMEFVEGETLATVLERGVPSLVETLRYGAEIAEGLANAHTRGLVHRDIKPSNIMVTPHGHVKLLDFGIVRSNDLGSGVTGTQSALTKPGTIAGTAFYMSPEQALGMPVNGRADLFSLGAVLFQCVTGELPFEGTTRDGYVQAMLAGRVRSIEQLAPATPPTVCKIVRRCLEREWTRRPETATELAGELRDSAARLSDYVTATAVAQQSRLRRAVQVLGLLLALSVLVVGYRWGGASPKPSEALPRTMVAAVTWPSAESDPRLSPDGRWLSFLSDRDGALKLFVQPLDGGKAVPLDISGSRILSHAWSPDGREIACVVEQGSEFFLQIVPAFFGGLPRASIPLTPPPETVRVIRWIAGDVFLDVNRGFAGHPLWQVSIATGAVQDWKKSWPPDLVPRSVDVSADGREVVLTQNQGGQSDLWVAHLDGSGLRRLTNDSSIERAPVWIGNTNVVAFQSGRSGPLDLWEIDTGSGRAAPLTSSPTVEVPGGSTPDGSVVAYLQTAQSATLWSLDGASKTPRQLTADVFSDFWPSASLDGKRLAFQRADSTVREGFEYLDSRVLISHQGLETSAEPQIVGEGFAARLSPDGTWVAYFQRRPEPTEMTLQAKNLSTGESRLIWNTCPLAAHSSQPPVDWLEQLAAWRPDSVDLLFVGGRDKRQFIGRTSVRSSAAPDVLFDAPAGVFVHDVRPSPDGRSVAYLTEKKGVFALHARDLQTGRDQLVTTEASGVRNVMLRGWASRASLIVLHYRVLPASTFEVDVFEAPLAGEKRRIATITGAYPTTARLDASGGRLLITRLEAGVHNIFALALADGRLQRITDNRLPGVSFSGIEPRPSGGIVYSRAEWRRDIWLARKQP